MTTRRYWICQITGWTLYALVNYGLGLALYGPTLDGLGFSFGTSALGLAGTHGLRDLILARGWIQLPLRPLIVRMVGASVVTAFGMAAIVVATFAVSGWMTGSRLVLFFGTAFNWTALILLWSAIYAGVHLVERWRQAERERAEAEAEAERWRLEAIAREAELRALRAQVNPHFLFNSLNTVRALVGEDPDRARDAITDLADLLRYALAAGQRETVSLDEEIEAVRRTLAIEGLRFERRLDAHVEVDDGALEARLPPMVVQTLVENAVKHGIDRVPGGGAVRVEARRASDAVRVTVDSPGRLDTTRANGAGAGLGLANATERLQRLCGDGARLTLVQASPDTVRAEIVVPVGAPAVPPSLDTPVPDGATLRAPAAAEL